MSSAASTFNAAASQYDQQLQQGLILSGETADYFVEGRVEFLGNYLEHQVPLHGLRVLDFGCGIGNASGALKEKLHAAEVVGYDCSAESIAIAEERYPGASFYWTSDAESIEPASIDVVYTSGVFHHIAPEDRQIELERIYGWLKPGGYFALFENNPWNPATHWVMSRIPFDADAKCLSPLQTRKRLSMVGFQVQLTRSLFFFPRILRFLRPMESMLSSVPLGAQYVVVSRRLS